LPIRLYVFHTGADYHFDLYNPDLYIDYSYNDSLPSWLYLYCAT
jgi:hypothetical protein